MVEIRLTNSRTRKKEPFAPIDAKNVRVYACGPTVYDRAHLGNARPVVVFDVLFRLLRQVYGENAVTYVRNFTDVEDKINARAAETGRPIRDITEETIGWYHDDMDALGALRPNHEPRATDYIAQMIAMNAKLIAKGFAYEAEGHVLFEVRKFPEYGQLSRRSLDDMIAGARVEVAPFKRDPMDFVLWKPSDADQPGWDSPWGRGRPGWHIECSAMSAELLGDVFDIHAGGIDLQFPHHENEIAQSRCAHGTGLMANVWLHNEMVQVEGKKMSKSLGNFFTVRDILKEFDAEDVRMFMLSAQYRSPINFSREMIAQAHASLSRLYTARDQMVFLLEHAQDRPMNEDEQAFAARIKTYGERFDSAMDDDLNTADAIGALFEIVRDANVTLTAESSKAAIETALNALVSLCDVLGLMMKKAGELPADIQALADARVQARKDRDWKKSDELRDQLKTLGYIVEDTKEGQKVRKAV